MNRITNTTESTMQPADTVLDNYRLGDPIGAGGMGTVYKAVDITTKNPVAVKLLSRTSSRSCRARFVREAEATARLDHPNIVPVLDYGESSDGQLYLVMPLIEGTSLDRFVSLDQAADTAKKMSASHQFSREQILHLGSRLADAICHAHANQIVHRDIKPANLILDRNGKVWITDFGLAKLTDETSDLSCTGDLIGTPSYMAPEQVRGVADERSDIFSIGVVLYELVAGHRAWSGHGKLKASGLLELPRIREQNPAVSSDLDQVIMTACSLQPEDRYQTAQAFLADLNRLIRGKAVQPPPVRVERAAKSKHLSLLALASIGVVSIALAVFQSWPGKPIQTPAPGPVVSPISLPPASEPLVTLELNENTRHLTNISEWITPVLQGQDASQFQIVNGNVEFRFPPNFEDPQDDNRDNEYLVSVIDAERKRDFKVLVSDVNEPPRIRQTRLRFTSPKYNQLVVGQFPVFDSEDQVGEGVLVSVTGGPDFDRVITSKGSDTARFLLPSKPTTEHAIDKNQDKVFEVDLTATDRSFLHVAGVMTYEKLPGGQALMFGKMTGKRANIAPVLETLPNQDKWIGLASADGRDYFAAVRNGDSIQLYMIHINADNTLDVKCDRENCGLPLTVQAMATCNGEIFHVVERVSEKQVDLVTYQLNESEFFTEMNRVEGSSLPPTTSALATCDGRLFMYSLKTKKGSRVRWAGLFDPNRDLSLQPNENKLPSQWNCCAQWIERDDNSRSTTQRVMISVAP